MLKLSVRMLDDVLRLGPIRGGVDPDLVVLVCGEQFGAVYRVEVGCDGAGDAVKASSGRRRSADDRSQDVLPELTAFS